MELAIEEGQYNEVVLVTRIANEAWANPAPAICLSACSRLPVSHAVAGVAAAIVMERIVYLDLGGFDPAYKTGYWENVDLAMRVRQAGLELFLQSLSIVYHQEGSTLEAGSESAAYLLRKYQLMAHNRAIFLERCVCIAWTQFTYLALAAPALALPLAVKSVSYRIAASIDPCIIQILACKKPTFFHRRLYPIDLLYAYANQSLELKDEDPWLTKLFLAEHIVQHCLTLGDAGQRSHCLALNPEP